MPEVLAGDEADNQEWDYMGFLHVNMQFGYSYVDTGHVDICTIMHLI